MNLTLQDHTEIHDVLARYCWFLDHGEGDAWADLWQPDGSFTGIPEPLHGHEALRQMPAGFHSMFSGKLRHNIANIVIEPGTRVGQVLVRAYSTVSDWRAGGKLMNFADVSLTLVKHRDQWRIQSLHAQML
jgi:hypothetical protein